MTVKSGQALAPTFTTSDYATGAALDATGTPVGTLYVDGVASVAGVTVTKPAGTGIYKAAVTLPALTAGQVVAIHIAATVNAVNQACIVFQDAADTVYVSEVQAVVVAGVAVTLTAASNVETTGTLVGGTFASTYLSNGAYWITAPVTPAVATFGLNVYLGFVVGATQTINSVTIRGFFNAASSRNCNVYAYNWGTLAWDQLSDSVSRMNNASTNQQYTYTLLSSHQKADGTVQIGFKSTSVTTGDRLNIDQCIISVATAGSSAADVANAVWLKTAALNYDGGVTIDTIAGTAGTSIQDGCGTPQKPVLTYADAIVIASNLGVKRIYLRPGSSITLTQNHDNWRFSGAGIIALGGQSIANAVFEGCYTITGVGVGDDMEFSDCGIGTATLEHSYFKQCLFKGTLTMVAASEYFMLNCSDATPTAGSAAIFIFAATTLAAFRDWRGSIQIQSMVTGNECLIDGAGRVIIHASSTGGALTVRGHFAEPTGVAAFVAAGGVLTDLARWAEDQNVAGVTGLTLTTLVADVWTNANRTLTQSAATVAAAASGSTLGIVNTAGFTTTITGLTIPVTWTAMLFSIKGDVNDTDAQSIVQIRKSNPGVGTDGLLYLEGAASTIGWGSLTVSQAAGTVAIVLTANATALLGARGNVPYDLKLLRSDGEPSVLTQATANISRAVTRALV